MGATTFMTAAWGKTARDAFAIARETALYDHGHAGYTGTIAEKHDFATFELPPRVSLEKLLEWVREAEDGVDLDYRKEHIAYAEQGVRDAKPGHVRAARKRLTEARQQLAIAERAQAKALKAQGAHHALVEKVGEIYDDKWGPACCFEIRTAADKQRYGTYADRLGTRRRGDNLYVFCGWASC